MLNKIKKNKNAQSADTLTWIVATVVIIFILGIFVFISNGLAKANQISSAIKEFFSGEKHSVDVNWLSIKTNLAYEKNSQNKDVIGGWINEE